MIGRKLLIMLGVLLFGIASPALASGDPKKRCRFDIEPGEAAYRLNDLSTQSGLQLLFGFEDMRGIQITPVHGAMRPFDALDRMIAGTRIRYEFINQRTVTLTLAPPTQAKVDLPDRSRRNQRDTGHSHGLDEVVIQSHLSTVAALTERDPQSWTRDDLTATNASTVPEVLRTIPQIFGGGPTEDTNQGIEARTNAAKGTGVNLRGLGAGSTLILIDGHRLPMGGSEGLFVDVAAIPLAAIHSIDILPDTSSTIYGSDAVGGVVNFVTRRDDRAESEARIGSSTSGSVVDRYVSQILGHSTPSGRYFAALDFYSRDGLPAGSRRLAQSDLTPFGGHNFDAPQSNPGTILGPRTWAIPRGQDGTNLTPSDLLAGGNLQNRLKGADILPAQKRASAFASSERSLSDQVTLFGQTLFSEREARGRGTGAAANLVVPPSNPFYVDVSGVGQPTVVAYSFLEDLGPLLYDARVHTSHVAAGLQARPEQWTLTTTMASAAERIRSAIDNSVDFNQLTAALSDPNPATAFNPFGDGSYTGRETLAAIRTTSTFRTASTLTSAQVVASREIGRTPAGAPSVTVGGDLRRQSFASRQIAGPTMPAVVSDSNRTIDSAFAEFRLPLFDERERGTRGIQELGLAVAHRHEHYSDFGDTETSRLTIHWAPVEFIRVRGTFSESVRPPSLSELDESSNSYGFVVLPDARGTPSNILIVSGNNRDLREEGARSWTVGAQVAPSNAWSMSVTYFDTHFSDRVATPVVTSGLLSDPALAPLVTASPTLEYRERVCSRTPRPGSPIETCLLTPSRRLRTCASATPRALPRVASTSWPRVPLRPPSAASESC